MGKGVRQMCEEDVSGRSDERCSRVLSVEMRRQETEIQKKITLSTDDGDFDSKQSLVFTWQDGESGWHLVRNHETHCREELCRRRSQHLKKDIWALRRDMWRRGFGTSLS